MTHSTPDAHFDRRISSTYSINRDDISEAQIAETIQDCLTAIRTISSIDVCSIVVTVRASSLIDTVNVTVQVDEGTGRAYVLDKVEPA